MRRAWLLLPLLLPCLAIGQSGKKIQDLLFNAHAAPNHDTAYIATYKSNLMLSLVAKAQVVDIAVEPELGEDLTFSLNGKEQYGLGLDYKWLSVEATFHVPALSDHDPALGSSTSRGLALGFTGRRLWGRGFWNTTQGYYLNDPERWTGSAAPLVREDLENRTFLLSVNYALSKKRRFSQNAALFQMERQKKSAGTAVAGLSAWHTTLSADSSLLDPALVDTVGLATGFSGLQRLLVGATIGYAHTFAFGHKGFLHAAILPGVVYADQSIRTPAGTLRGQGSAAVAEVRFGAGFNGDRWFGALTGTFYYSTTPIAERLSLGTNYGTVRFVLGIRLGDPGIKALGKVGL